MANIFYSLGKLLGLSSKYAEKQFFTNRVTYLGRREAVWVDTEVPYKLYNSIPELNQVIKIGRAHV